MKTFKDLKRERELFAEASERGVDKATVQELVLYITNDAKIFRQRIQPIIKNLSKKVGKATYDGNKAIKAFGYAVTDGLKKYEKEHASKGWAKSVSKQTKEAIAEELLDYYSEQIGEEKTSTSSSIVNEVLMVRTQKTSKGDFEWIIQKVEHGKTETLEKGTEPSRAKAMAAGKKARKGLSLKEDSRSAGYKMGQSKDPYTVKYSAKKSGPVKITVVDGKKEAEKFLKDIKKQGMNGIIKKGWTQPGSTHTIKYGQSHTELSKAARYDTLTGKKRWGEEIEMEGGMGNNPPKKRPMSAAQKARHEKHQQFLKISGMKKSKAPRKAAAKKRAKSAWSGTRYEDIEKEIEEMAVVFDEARQQPTGWERSASKKAAKEYKKLMAKHTKTRVFDIPFAEFREIETAANKVMGVRPGGKLTPGSLVRDLEKFATNESVVVGMDEASSSKGVKREYEKLMKKWGDTPITKIPFKDFERIRELGDNLMGTPKGAGTKVGDLLKHMKELYAPGNISRNRNPDFDERQAMFNSNYKRIHKKNPSKAEMRAAGVGKGGDNPKGVKAWKAAMAKLKASEGRK